MARGLWQRLKDLPPIDWAALAAQQVRPSRAGPQPRAWSQKAVRVRLKNAKRKARAAGKRRFKEQIADRKKRKTANLDAVMLSAMEPGQWYGRPDITAASGAKRNSVHIRLARWERDGWVERAENEDWKPTRYPKGSQIHFQARGRPPRYLFRLTERGERERRQRAFLA